MEAGARSRPRNSHHQFPHRHVSPSDRNRHCPWPSTNTSPTSPRRSRRPLTVPSSVEQSAPSTTGKRPADTARPTRSFQRIGHDDQRGLVDRACVATAPSARRRQVDVVHGHHDMTTECRHEADVSQSCRARAWLPVRPYPSNGTPISSTSAITSPLVGRPRFRTPAARANPTGTARSRRIAACVHGLPERVTAPTRVKVHVHPWDPRWCRRRLAPTAPSSTADGEHDVGDRVHGVAPDVRGWAGAAEQTTDPPLQVLPLVSRHRPRSFGTTHDGWSSWVPVTTRALTYRSWLVAGSRPGS